MRKAIFSLVFFLTAYQYLQAQVPGLGSYPVNVIVTAGANTTAMPSVAPVNTASLVAYTNSNFKGSLQVSPATGIVMITNAHPAGIYNITVKAFNGILTATSNFTLIVNNTACSQGLFTGTENAAVGSLPYSVVVGDFNNDGKQDLASANYGFNTVSIRLGNGSGAFNGATNIPVGNNPQALAIGDFNGDGKEDIAVANFASFNISILLGNGSGGFSAAVNVGLAAGSFPYALAVGDFNADGKQDLAAANYGNNNISIHLGDGSGNFSGTSTIPVGNGPRSIAIGDFNSDGKQDLATANYFSNTISIRFGNGLGGFTGTGNNTVGNNPHSIVIGDFNNDGKQDLATANISNGSVSIRLGDGLGNFGGTTEVNVGTDPRSVAIGDFNGDGKQDLAIANYSTNIISVRLGDGGGGFNATTAINVENSPFSVAVGDFNADGKQDILASNAGSSDVSIRLGVMNEINIRGNNINIADGDNTPDAGDHTDFGNVTNNLTHNFSIQNTSPVNLTINGISMSGADASLFTTGNMSFPLVMAGGGSLTFPVIFIPTSTGLKTATVNIMNDNCEKQLYDFAVQGTGIALASTLGIYPASISTAGGNITVTPDAIPSNTENITAYTSTGFKGLMQVDPLTGVLAITNAHPAGVYTITVKANGVSTVMRSFTLTVNNTVCSQGLFGPNVNMPGGPGVRSVAIGDFNRDGIQDIAVGSSSNGISIRNGNASGGFNISTAVPITGNLQSIVVGDFNGDGRQDIASANGSSNDISIRLGNSSGGFSGTGNILVGANPLSIGIGDFNGDGKQDLVTANYGSNNVSVLLGDGLSGFAAIPVVTVGNGPWSIIVGDFNGDGKQDIATANQNSNNVSIRLGDGAGGFTGNTDIPVGANPYSITAGDFNNDGKQDLVTANYGSNNVSINLGDGTGNFTAGIMVAVGDAPILVVTGDFNGDGKQDIATANNNSNNVSIRLGDGTGNFLGNTNVAIGGGPISLAAGDFNGDGRQDLVTANAGSADVSIVFSNINDINVQGNNTIIADGDNTATLDDHTDFGNVSGNLIRTFVIQNTGAVNLLIKNISMSGADASLFTVGNIGLPVSIAAGASIQFTLAFVPTTAGVKTATVNISNDNCDKTIYDFAVKGTGVVLVPNLGIYPAANIATAGGNITVTPLSAPANAQNITAFTSADFKGLLQVDTITGVVTITNAHPAGSYMVTVKAYGISTATRNFILTVSNTVCSQGLFNNGTNAAVDTNPFSIAIGDFNGDGRQDIATANYSANTVSIRLGDGLGNFNGTTNVSVGNQPFSVAIGDFNGDGKEDIVTANHGSNSVSIRMGNGTGNFYGTTELSIGAIPTLVATGDFNADGKLDLAVAVFGNNTVAILLGDGTGNFGGSTNISVGSSLFSLAVADFNADGKQDIATANYNVNTVSIYLGDGLGTFTATAQVAVGINPYAITTGDFNGDSKQDIATANYNNNNVSVCLGDGSGNFSVTMDSPVGNGPGSLAAGDFNGDGKQDIVTANYLSNNISIRLGDGTGGFNGTMNITVGTGPESIAIGDFNADGKQDIVVANNGNNNVSVRLGTSNEINVQGNNLNIVSGDTTAMPGDNTDFGISNDVTHSFNIQNSGNANLAVTSITMNGTNASLFTVSGIGLPVNIPPGGSAAFMIHFIPTSAGQKTAVVNINNDDCDEGIYSFAVQGTFDCPQVVVNFTGLATSYCLNAPPVMLTGNHPSGTVFTGAGITDNGNGTAIFDPFAAGPGLHIINSVYTDNYGCTHSSSQAVMVNPLPVVSFNGLAATYFITDPTVTLTGNPSANGIFIGPGITANGNGTAIFNPATAGEGTHSITYTYTDLNGCAGTHTQQVSVLNTITLNVKLYLQGYYTGSGTMQPVLNNQGVPLSLATETDIITIELHDPVTFALIDTKQALLLTDGTSSVAFSQPAGIYYIAIKHRNTLQTWTAEAIACTGSTGLYDFSIAASQAMGDNQVLVEPGVWAFLTGDINQDDYIDGNDFPQYDFESASGGLYDGIYSSTDMNGDGFIDGNDFPVFDGNSSNGASSIHP